MECRESSVEDAPADSFMGAGAWGYLRDRVAHAWGPVSPLVHEEWSRKRALRTFPPCQLACKLTCRLTLPYGRRSIEQRNRERGSHKTARP